MVKLEIIKIVPNILPKIKPEIRAMGDPKPSNKTHITENKKNKIKKIKKF